MLYSIKNISFIKNETMIKKGQKSKTTCTFFYEVLQVFVFLSFKQINNIKSCEMSYGTDSFTFAQHLLSVELNNRAS